MSGNGYDARVVVELPGYREVVSVSTYALQVAIENHLPCSALTLKRNAERIGIDTVALDFAQTLAMLAHAWENPYDYPSQIS